MDPLENKLGTILRRGWWALLLRGVAAIAFAVLTWLKPGISLTALVLLFGWYAIVDGIFGVWMAVAGRKLEALALLFYIAIWAIATGALQIVVAIRLRREIANEWLLVLGGLASVAFGVLLMARPEAGALAVLSLIAAFAFVFGVILVALAFRARSFASQAARA
jgi:uncharacterized membrane protein HdeD (DUF308 family)